MTLPDSDDTIVAISTPPGHGGIGVIRISGKQAFTIANTIIDTTVNIIDIKSHTIHHGYVRGAQSGSITDEVLVAVLRAPSSSTGEDVIEISAHGNPQILKRIVGSAIDSGARQAAAGEFTMRAFLSGRFDLVQAESVADLIAAEGAAFQQVALYQLSGKLSGYIGSIRAQLLDIGALFEAYTDFPDEEIPQQQQAELLAKLDDVTASLSRLASSYRRGEIIRAGVQIPIVGPPNAGKSSLFNAILAEERAIVTEIPGTTRDTIAEKIEIEGIAVRFVDTAGLREAANQIEAAGVERSRREIDAANLVIAVFDVTDRPVEMIQSALFDLLGKYFIVVLNKIDLVSASDVACLDYELGDCQPILLSAKTLVGVDKLVARVASVIRESMPISSVDANTLTNRRHFVAVQNAVRSLTEARAKLEQGDNFELMAFDLRQATNNLEEILGKITTDDLLAEIFSRFCIGK
ncbi:MAG: tRNA uridine-5-carboxymethylaminomethyl(34) synthesis GTPase MnmE [candidate division Zixibacteria bacterium]|nr:tRNA uridine-5-carboxymethylaminomethyl(34) synthesis GTPase MnmE [candidate division Zixibacteria bacterium]